MKPHLVIRFQSHAGIGVLPHWTRFIHEKLVAPTRIHPGVDAVFEDEGRAFWAGAEYAGSAVGGWTAEERRNGLDRVYRLILREEGDVHVRLLGRLRALEVVESVAVGEVGKVELPVARASSMSRRSSDWSHAQIGLEAAHALTQGHPEVIVAVLDTGVDLGHPELVSQLMRGRDFVNILSGAEEFFGDTTGPDDDPADELVGHGTHVAGIIAAKGISMPVGVAPRCRILPVRVLGAVRNGNAFVGAGLVDNINNGIKWAVDQGASVINMSLGIPNAGGGLPHEEMIEYAERKGVTVVAASGNDGTEERYYPGALTNVIAVGATGREGQLTAFTSFGKVTCLAPGEEIYSAHVKQGYAFASGTSQAAPFVAGAAALLYSRAREKGKRITPQQVRYILSNTADRPGLEIRGLKTGYGRINLPDALRLLDYKLDTPTH